jgi:hypothetical protein
MAIQSAAARRMKLANQLQQQADVVRVEIENKLGGLARDIALQQSAIYDARRRGRADLATTLEIELWALYNEKRRTETTLSRVAASPDALAGEIAERGLDMSLSIVEEDRPDRPQRSEFVWILIAVVVGTGALIGATLVIGTFDSRVHDTDDVARLGLPVLGQIPRFPGDNVGSLQARGATRARVPSFLRWRSHR